MADKDKTTTVNVTFSNKTIIKVVVFIVATLVAINFVSNIAPALRLIIISIFLALALNPAVGWLTRHIPGKSRLAATAAAYLVVISVLTGFIIIVVPPFVSQMFNLVDQIPLSVQDLQNQDSAIVHFIEEHDLTNDYTKLVGDIKDNLDNVTGRAISAATLIGGGLVALITVLVMTFMMLLEGPRWVQRMVSMQPKTKVDKRVEVMSDMYRLITGYVNGQLLIAIIAATFAFFALAISSTLLHASINPIALAAIVGLIGLIPMIGNTIAAVIVVLFCLFASLPLAIIMAVFFLVYQQVENATLQPYIQSKYNELTPLTVFIAAIIGVSIAGFLGALIAIPIVGCLRIYVKAYYGHKLTPKNAETISV